MALDLNQEAIDQGQGEPQPRKPPKARLDALAMRRRTRTLAEAPGQLGLAPPAPLPPIVPPAPQPVAPADVMQVAKPSQLEVMRNVPPLPIATAPRQPTPIAPPSTVGPAPAEPTLAEKIRAYTPREPFLSAQVGLSKLMTHLPGSLGEAAQEQVGQLESEVASDVRVRAQHPILSAPTEALNLISEFETLGRLPLVGKVISAPAPEATQLPRLLGVRQGGRLTAMLEEQLATSPATRLGTSAATEAARFGTLQGSMATLRGESPSDIAREMRSGAAQGALFGGATQGAAEAGLGIRRAIARRTMLAEQPPLEAPPAPESAVAPEPARLGAGAPPAAAEAAAAPEAPPEAGTGLMAPHVRARGLQQLVELATPPPAPRQLPPIALAREEKELRETPPPDRSAAAARVPVPETPTFEEFLRGKGGAAAEYRDQLRAQARAAKQPAAAATPPAPATPAAVAEPGQPYGGEYVQAAALRDPATGRVFTGRLHMDALQKAVDAGASWAKLTEAWDREDPGVVGFVTSAGRFVSRDEAGRIAIAQDQLSGSAAEDAELEGGRGRPFGLRGEDIAEATAPYGGVAERQTPYPRERVVAAAVRTPGDEVFTGTTHGEAYAEAVRQGGIREGEPVTMGWKTSHRSFLELDTPAEKALTGGKDSYELGLPAAAAQHPAVLQHGTLLLRRVGVLPQGAIYESRGVRMGRRPSYFARTNAGVVRSTATGSRRAAELWLREGFGELAEAAPAYPASVPEIIFPAESVSSGVFGFVPQLAGAPAPVLEELSARLDREAGPAETELAGQILGQRWPTTEARGYGMWRGQVNPNVITRIPAAAGAEYAGLLAGIRGLVRGQDYQLWWRRLPEGDAGGTSGFVVHSEGRALTEGDYRQLEEIIRRDPELAGAVDGSTFAADHVLFLNRVPLPEDQYQELLDRAIAQLPDELQLRVGVGRFQLGEYNGPRHFLQAIGRRPDALRRVADLFARVARPAYEAAARAVGEDPAVAGERLEAHARFLRAAADAAQDTAGEIQRVFQGLTPDSPRVSLEVAKLLAKSAKPSLEHAPPAQQLERLVQRGLQDLRDAMRLFHTAGGWYDLDVQRAHALALAELPRTRELGYRTIFDAVLAVLSNGNEIRPNWESALAVMRNYDRSGHLSLYAPGTRTERITTKRVATTIRGRARRIQVARRSVTGTYAEGVRGHERQQVHERGLERLDQLIQAKGLDGAAHALLELLPKGPRTPELFPQFYHLVGTDPIKIASFFANLSGLHDFVTVDQWMQKWFYNSLGFVRLEPVRVKEGGRWRPVAGEFRVDETPKASEASLIRQAVRTLAAQASADPTLGGQTFTPASVQALLWYLEKYRYASLGAPKTEAISFSQAAADLLWGPGGDLVAGAAPAYRSPNQLELELNVPEVEHAFGSQAKADAAVDNLTRMWEHFQTRNALAREIVAELQQNRVAVWQGKQIPLESLRPAGIETAAVVTPAAETVAAILQSIRSPLAETMALFGLKDGKVEMAWFLTSGQPGFVVIGTGGGYQTWQDFLNEARARGITQTASAHNHPSGKPTPSGIGFDLSAFDHFRRTAFDAGLEHVGDLVIDDDTFSWTTAIPGPAWRFEHGRAGQTTLHAYSSTGKATWLTPHPFAGPQEVFDPQAIASFIDQNTRDEGIYAVHVGTGGRIVGIENYPTGTQLYQVRDRVVAEAAKLGATRVFLGLPRLEDAELERVRYAALLRLWNRDGDFGRIVQDIVLFGAKKSFSGVTEARPRELVVRSAYNEHDLDLVLQQRRWSAFAAQQLGVRVGDSGVTLTPRPAQSGYLTDPVVQGSRPLQPVLGTVQAGIPQSWRDAIGPIVGEDGLPNMTGLILQDGLADSEYGITPQAQTAVGKLLTAFGGTRLEQIGPALHYLMVEYERQRATIAREAKTAVVQESLNDAAVDFVARLPYFDTPKAVTLLSYLRDKLPRAIGRKLGVTPDRQEALFNAAEAIAEFDTKGDPVFRDILERSGELDQVGLAQLNRIYGSPAKLEAEVAELQEQLDTVRAQRDREGLRPTEAAIERFKARRRAQVDLVKAEDRQLLSRVKAERDAALQAVRLLKMADPAELDDPDAGAAFEQDLQDAERELAGARARVAHVEGIAAGRIRLGPGLAGETLQAELERIEARQQVWRDLQGQLGELHEIRKNRRAMLSQYKRATRARGPGQVRVTAEEARRRWQGLSGSEKDIVRRFAADAQTAHRAQLSAHVNRELAKLEYNISSDIEAYVHHYGFLDEGAVSQFFGSDLRRQKLIAPAKRRRGGAEGFTRHLEGARLHGSVPLALAQLHNEFTETFERLMLANPDPNLARPLVPEEQPAPGYRLTEVNGRRIAFGTVPETQEAPEGYQVKVQPDGTRTASKLLEREEPAPEGMTRVVGRFGEFLGKPYAIANMVYKEFEYFTRRPPAEPTTDAAANRLWATLKNGSQKAVYYWALNQLISLGTYMRNLYSGVFQYEGAISEAIASGDFHAAQKYLLAMARALAPKNIRILPYTEFGATGASLMKNEDQPAGILHAVMTTALLPMGMVENLFKRALTLGTRELEAERVADEMLKSGAISKAQREPTIRQLFGDPTADMRVAEEAVRDAFAFNYNNLPLALRKVRKSVIGKALIPFPAYGYKLARFYGRYAGAATRLARGKARRGDLAKVLAAIVIFGLPAVLTWLGDEKGKARTVDPGSGIKYDFDRSGRVYLGLNDHGQEEWLLTQSYGPIGLAAALGHTAHDATTVELRNYLSTYYSVGPGFQLADFFRQTRNRYQAYRNNGAIMGDVARSWIPFHRPLESLTHIVDPTKRKQESFVQSLLAAVPVSEPALESVGLTRGLPRTAYNNRALVPPYDPWLEFLKEFGGINIKLIDPAQAQDEYLRAAARAQTSEWRDAAKRFRIQQLDRARRERQGEPNDQ